MTHNDLAEAAADAWRVPGSTRPPIEMVKPKDDCVYGYQEGYLAALQANDWRPIADALANLMKAIAESDRIESGYIDAAYQRAAAVLRRLPPPPTSQETT